MTINDPDVVAELRVLYPRYEEALVSNDVDTLVAMFWASLPRRASGFRNIFHTRNRPAERSPRSRKIRRRPAVFIPLQFPYD
jgi:hypothetical protein